MHDLASCWAVGLVSAFLLCYPGNRSPRFSGEIRRSPDSISRTIAVSAALIGVGTRFKGLAASEVDYTTRSFECQGCSNICEVVEIRVGHEVLGRWGGRCGKWDA